MTGACHAERAELLTEVARCAHNWEVLSGIWFTEAKDWSVRMKAAEASLIAACVKLAAIPDCSE